MHPGRPHGIVSFAVLALGAASGLAIALGGEGQTQEPPVPVFAAAIDLVQLDVVVSDAKGEPVRDLRREDFEILEDEVPQPISHFAVGTASRPAARFLPGGTAASSGSPPGSPPAAAAAGRTIVLVFDDLHLGAGHLSAAKRGATRFLQEQVGPRDMVALVTTSGARGLFQALTRDRDVLVRAIGRVSLQDRGARFRFGSPYISEQQAEQLDRFGEFSAGNEAFELAVAQFAREFMCGRDPAIQMVRERVRSILEEGQRYSRASLSMVETTVRSLAPLPGRKIVVLLSEGFFLGRQTWYDSAYDLRRITDAATRSGAVVYSLDAGGLTVPAPAGDITEREFSAMPGPLRSSVERFQDEARREGMKAVADETGGFAVLDNNDIGSGLRRVLDDNEVYYLLAYEPVSPRRAGRFRSVQVRLPSHPDLVARTRKGYFEPVGAAPDRKPRAPSRKQAAAAARERVHDAFTSIVPLQGLPIRLLADFVDLPDAGPTVVVNMDVEVATPASPGDGTPRPRGIVELVGLVSDTDGTSVEQFAEQAPLERRPGAPDAAPRDGVSLSRRLRLKPGLYQVRVAALGEGSDRTGSASRWVEVPDLAARHLTLSGLFLDQARDGPGAGGSQEGRQPGSKGRVMRSFPAGSDIDVVLFVYNAGVDGAGASDLAARYQLRSEGRLVHEFQPRPLRSDGPGAPERIPGGVRLSLAGLPPGDYELRAVVEDRRAGTTAEREVELTVE